MPNMLCIPILPDRLEGRSGSLKAALADARPNVVQFCDKDRDCEDNKKSIEAARRGDGDARAKPNSGPAYKAPHSDQKLTNC